MTHAMSHTLRPTGPVPTVCLVRSTVHMIGWCDRAPMQHAYWHPHHCHSRGSRQRRSIDIGGNDNPPTPWRQSVRSTPTVSIQAAGLWWNHTSLKQRPIEPFAVNPAKASRPYTFRESYALCESYVPARHMDEQTRNVRMGPTSYRPLRNPWRSNAILQQRSPQVSAMQDGTASDPNTFLQWLTLGNQHQYKIAKHFELEANMPIQRLHVNRHTHHQLVVLLRQLVFHT